MQINQKHVALAVGAVLAGVGASAQAASLSDNSTGSYLSYPYYSVANGNDTYVSVVNSTNSGKIVKIRFREGMNSKEVLDFNLFLSKNDVWAAAITSVKTAGAVTGVQLKWGDTSCTVPAFSGNTASFSNGLLNETDGGTLINNSVARMLDGHIEIIEMATVDQASTVGTKFDHGTVGVPKDCAWLNTPGNLYSDSSNVAPAYQGAGALPGPTGGLFGGATLINVAEGTSVSYDATALNNTLAGAVHFGPGSVLPNVRANGSPSAAFLSNGTYYNVSTVANLTANQDGASLPLMKTAVLGEWAIDKAVGLSTDVAVTLTNRWAYQRVTQTRTSQPEECLAGMNLPFTSNGFCKNGSPEPIVITQWDREEQTNPGVGFCPSPIVAGSPCAAQGGQFLPWENNILSFGASSDAIKGNGLIKQTINPLAGKENGWFRMNLGTTANFIAATGNAATTGTACAGMPIKVFGLPAEGFIAQKYVNGNVGGVLSNYGVNFGLKSEKVVTCG